LQLRLSADIIQTDIAIIAAVTLFVASRLALAETPARLRADLEIRPETSDQQSPVVVKDPVTRRFYRFTWVQATVLRGLDGLKDAGTVAKEASAHCQLQVELSQVEDFIGKLRGLLLLDDALSGARLETIAKQRRRLIDTLLSIKIHAVHPDGLLDRVNKRLGRHLYNRVFLAVAAASFATAVVLAVLNWQQLSVSISQLLNVHSLPLILLVAFVVMSAHELGHGLTLKHYGGKVEEMGLLLLYFLPGLYCNVSDAWLLKKRERMLVSLAGGFVQLFLWSWAVILWRLLSPEIFGSRVCLIVIAFAGIQTLFNFNPLIRLDGYYLLSDWLEIPNLRQKAFGYLRRKAKSLLVESGAGTMQATKRERRIFPAYGILSFAFSAGLLLFVLDRLGAWMVAEYKTWGIFLLSGICLMIIPAAGKSKHPAPDDGRSPTGTGIKIRKKTYKWIMLVLVLAAGFFPWELKIAGEFTILPTAVVQINPQVAGTLKAILVDEGSAVKKGDELAEMQNLDLSNVYEQTKGELASHRASLSLLKAGSRPEEIERARRAVETKKMDLENADRVEQERRMLNDTAAKKQAQLQNAQTVLERAKALYSNGLIARNELDSDQTAYEVAQKELAEAQGQLKVLEENTAAAHDIKVKELAQTQSDLDVLLAGSRKESIEAEEAEVTELEEKLLILGEQLEQLKIRSPIDGQVNTPYLKNKIGAYIDKGDQFCEIADTKRVIVDMPIPEKEIGDVFPGYPIVLKVRTYPNRAFVAQVKTISPVAVEAEQERTVVVRGELMNEDGALKSGMTGVGKIFCGRRLIIELVSRRLIRWLRTEFWEYLP
jgi:multidrug efflux pump subunit AcrA (membrane-fusion protein)